MDIASEQKQSGLLAELEKIKTVSVSTNNGFDSSHSIPMRTCGAGTAAYPVAR